MIVYVVHGLTFNAMNSLEIIQNIMRTKSSWQYCYVIIFAFNYCLENTALAPL